MSWAEFVLRSIGFRQEVEFEMRMTRAIAYQSHVAQYAFSKKKPPTIEKFWPIGEKSDLPDEMEEAFLAAHKKYLEETNA